MKPRSTTLTLWTARLIPALAWGTVIVPSSTPRLDALWDSGAFTALFGFIVCCYLAVAYYVIPELVAEGRPRSLRRRTIDFLLTGVTAGLYMVVAYWLVVDRSLRMMQKARKECGS